MESAKSRFLRYVTYYTTSDEFTGTSPSTERQKDLGRALMQELEALKLEDVHMDDCGNVLATLPASEGVDAPVIALIAHMDTAPDASGENVKPRLVRYEGGELKLNNTVSLTEALCPGLESHVGEELIVTDGTTLLGADDKAGVAEIMAAVETMIEKNVKHGEVRVIFTTDEEIGNGVDGLDVQELGCDYGYTVDGGPLGEIEFENFNAASAVLTVHGVGVHPGSAKNVMINAATAAMAFHAMLPEDEVPEKTDGYEGFFHLTEMSGSVTEATLRYIIRDLVERGDDEHACAHLLHLAAHHCELFPARQTCVLNIQLPERLARECGAVRPHKVDKVLVARKADVLLARLFADRTSEVVADRARVEADPAVFRNVVAQERGDLRHAGLAHAHELNTAAL